MTKHTHPKKNNNISNRGLSKRNNFYTKVIKQLLKIKKNGSGNITFYYRDGSMRSTLFSMELFRDERGNERRFGDIISILNDLKHDFKALYYIIT